MFNNKQEEKLAQEASNISNTIGKGTTLNGSIETYGNLRIEGKVYGDITAKSKVVIGKSAYIEGNILAQNADIEGEVKGKVEISDILVLKPTAKIRGDILTNKLIVESGAQFNGQSKMGQKVREIQIGKSDYGNAMPKYARKETPKSEEPVEENTKMAKDMPKPSVASN